MRGRPKQWVAFAVMAALIGTTACSSASPGKEAAPKDAGAAAGASAEQAKPVKFTYTLPGKFVNWMKDMNWIPVLLKQTGAEVELVAGGDGDTYYKNADLKIGSGDFSDAGIVQLSQADVYGTKGAFLDLKPLIEKYGPNIKKFMDQHPDLTKLVTSSNGKIYALVPEYPKISNVTFYRDDLLKKAGITSEPKTIQEFTDVLRKLKEANKDNKNFFPFGGRDDFLRFQSAFGAGDSIDAGGKVHGIYNGGQGSDIKAPGFKKLIEWYARLYDEKLVDPEWISGLATEEAWQTKMLNGNLVFGNDFYTRPAWFLVNGGVKNDPNYSLKVLPPFLDEEGKQSKFPTVPNYRTDRAFVINAKSADKAPGIIKFLDYMYSEQGQTLVGWGVEGTTFKKNAGGKNEFTMSFDDESTKPLGTPSWTFFQDRLTFPIPVNNEAFYEWNHSLTKSYANDYFSKYAQTFPILKYSTEDQKERSNLVAKVNEAIKANLVKFVTGKRPLSEWDAFLKEMDGLGYNKIIEIDQKAYDAVK
ncbi:extracellular solute-binding protein [Paenibacillus thalictri]|uniref:extracellular solute-binding protein n=1 Tax=Paenibacillus thalictri TaxID=2527873 RepID=UPI0013EF0ABA|nr:extracellular solute-binding protein [Paenibacillus thalictri]